MMLTASLSDRYTPFGYRGFESLTFRKDKVLLDKESVFKGILFIFFYNSIYIFFIHSPLILYTFCKNQLVNI